MANNLFSIVNSVTGNVVLSQGGYGFQPVIDDFQNASFINIVTYNITSFRGSELVTLIKDIPLEIPVNLILNIPKKSYGSSDAANQIYWYLRTLERHNFNDLNVYFNFSNHAKLIMTNNKAYIGSQNFSDASVDKIELGIIVENTKDLEKIRNNIFEVIKSNSIRYATSHYIIVMEEIKGNMGGVLEKLRSNIFTVVGDLPYMPEFEIFDINHAYFPSEEWSKFIDLERNLFEVIESISEEYGDFFNDSQANILREALKDQLGLFISNVNDFKKYMDSSENRLWDRFYEIDIGETDSTMNIVLNELQGDKDDKFSHLNGEELLVMFDQIEPVVENILDLIEEIKHIMLRETIYENLELIEE